MKNNFMLTDDLLWDYADGFLEEAEKLQVDAYLRQHPEHQARLQGILAEKRTFSNLPLEKPGSDFANKVMTAWAAEQSPAKAGTIAKPKGRDWILWSIALAFGIMLALPFLMPASEAPTALPLQIPADYLQQVQWPTFDWAGLFNSSLMSYMLLLTLAFMSLKLLDKYLQVRNMRLSGH